MTSKKKKDLRSKSKNYPREIVKVGPLGKPKKRPVLAKKSPPPVKY